MLDSDLAVTGSGTTLYEFAATGTSSLAFCLAENQLRNIKRMAVTEALINMGWGSNWTEKKFYENIDELIDNHMLRGKMSKLGQELIDGKGSHRVSRVIEEFEV